MIRTNWIWTLVVSGALGPPTNVTLKSRNLDLVLSWDLPEGSPHGLSYSTESAITAFQPACRNITELRCDLSLFNISIYGNYTGRVRHPLPELSDLIPVFPSVAIIGSPSVLLMSHHQTLVVSIEDPKFILSSLRNVFHSVFYNISYWKMGQDREVRRYHSRTCPHGSLSDYCVQVFITTGRTPHPSEPSREVCEKTDSEDSPWVPAVIVLVVMVILVILVVLVVLRWRHISQFLCLKDVVPDNVTQVSVCVSMTE
uniref:Interleukin 10 receptor, beta n=1 Tax=Nothobranchius furzeri TaxID=105023 RepID=A0A8C6LWC1_NOTFU